MIDSQALLAVLRRAPVVPVLIVDRAEDAAPLARALVSGGLPALEVTLRTPAALDVIRAMADIPFGETRTYGQIAKAVGAPAQAVGQACGANPLPILIPCHRVTGTNWFGGFSAPGGVETKAALLRHEGALLPIELANGVASLSTYPSARILREFSDSPIGQNSVNGT